MAPDSNDWQRYAQDELERQYNARGTVPDVEPLLREYRAMSDSAHAALPHVRQLQYGPSADETLDLFPVSPEIAGAAGAPLFVFVHGGYWRALGKQDSAFMAPMLNSAGIATAVLNYTLAPQASLQEIVSQCRRALVYLHQQATEHGVKPTGMVLAGSSAGAHLAAMMLSEEWQKSAGLPSDVTCGAVLLSGLYDLAPVQRTVPNTWLHLSDQDVVDLSPLLHLPPPSVALEVMAAEQDTDEFKRQSVLYAQACAAKGCKVSEHVQAGRNHFDVVMEWLNPQSDISRRTLALFSR